MIALLLFVSGADAGLLDGMTEADRHLETCKIAAEEAEAGEAWERLWGMWKACLAEAKRREFAELLPGLEAEVAVSGALVQASAIRTTQPHRWAVDVLSEAARWSNTEFPTDIVRRTFRAWMETDEGRAFVERVRTVSITWETPVDAANEGVIRRYVEDVGLKWTTPGDPKADTVLTARLDVINSGGESSAQGQLVLSTTTLTVSRVRFKSRSDADKGFAVSASAESPLAADATDRALRTTAEAASQRLLLRVLGVLFEP